MEIDTENKMVSREGKNINLTAKEFALLLLLARNKGRVVAKQDILEKFGN